VRVVLDVVAAVAGFAEQCLPEPNIDQVKR